MSKKVLNDPVGVNEIFDDEQVFDKPIKLTIPKLRKSKSKVVEPSKVELVKMEKLKINKRNPFNYLNNLTFTTESIKPIVEYLTNGIIPDLPDRPKKKFLKRFSNDWKVENNQLIFVPLNLLVITENNIDETLQTLYDDPVQSLAKGIQSFYDTVKSRYLGISRKIVENFLKKQEVYQMTFVKKKINQKPIYAKFSNEKWSCDLIDLNQYVSQNSQYRYILTVIDYFSRKVFCEKLKNKDLESTIKALNSIISKQAFNTTPQLLICDNGSEFELDSWCKEKHIKLIHTVSHSPTQNALIENFNGSLRRLIRANFVRRNDLNWIEDLEMLVKNYNSKKHRTTKYIPDEIWSEEKNKVKIVEQNDELEMSKEQKIGDLSTRTIDKVTKQFEKLKNQNLVVGDFVRIATTSLNSEVRKLIKAGNSKLVVVKFSAKIFTIDKVIKSRAKKDFQLDTYTVKDSKGNVQFEEFNLKYPNKVLKPQRFNITELLKIDPQTKSTRNKAIEEKLNKIENIEYVAPEVEETPRKSERLKEVTAKEKAKSTREANKVIQEPVRKSSRIRKQNEILDL